ncbi:hypothetical protein JCGZ_03019 [Jatropha curcas]|uniref:Aminotransferase-like plant mobile domain-containing protein n=1 Tax=Jatropha curcas TaxID=180498 RepID=A0A067L153_JATCU|nr:hypothetical protein JCGZ_03019 [Jatropha curcas]
MAHLPEIHASTYTPEMDTLGTILDIPIFEGERVPMSRNALTPGTYSRKQLHDATVRSYATPLSLDFDFASLVCLDVLLAILNCDALSIMTCLGPVDLGKARAGGSSTDASAFWDLLDPPMRSRVVAAGFGDYTPGLRRTQPQFPLAMRYALMERWNDCTHSYSTAALGAELVRTLVGVPTRTRYTAQGYVSYEVSTNFGQSGSARDWQHGESYLRMLDLQLLLILERRGTRRRDVWAYEYRIYPGGLKSDTSTEARRIPRYLAHRHHTFSSFEDPHYWRCYLNDRALADLLLTPWEGDAWAAYPPCALAEALTRSRVLLGLLVGPGITPEDKLLEYDGSLADVYLIPGDYASYFTTRLQARLSEVREYSQDRRRHRTPPYYRAQAEADAPAGPTGAVLGDVPFPPGMEVALDPTLGLGPAIAIPTDLRQAPPQLQLDPEHATHVPAQRYQELYQRFCFARSYIVRLYPELHERDLEIGRLRRHQSRQSGAVSRLQMEVDRLRTRLEVEGIPLDFSEEEDDDDDGSSSDDAPTPPPSSVGQAAAGPSRRRR